MANRLFELSIEEEVLQEPEQEEILTAEDPIEKLEASFDKTANDTANEIESFENCSNCEEELTEQIEVIDEKLDNQPEEITEEVVEVTQEHFYNSIKNILTVEEIEEAKKRISNESITLPVEKLILTREGIMDVIKKIIEKIKQAFQQVGQFFKKLWTKFIVFMDGTAKKANALYKKYDGKTKGKMLNLTGDQFLKVSDLMGVMFDAKNSYLASQVLPYINCNAVSLDKVNNSEWLEKFGVEKNLAKTLKILQTPDPAMMAKIMATIDTLKQMENKSVNIIFVSSVVGKEAKYVYFKTNDDKTKFEDCIYETGQIAAKGVIQSSNYDANKIHAELKIIEKYAKGAGTYKDRLLEVQSSANKSLDQIYKNSNKQEFTKTQLKFIQILGSKIILDNIMQYVKTCSNICKAYEIILSGLDE